MKEKKQWQTKAGKGKKTRRTMKAFGYCEMGNIRIRNKIICFPLSLKCKCQENQQNVFYVSKAIK
jgi:hypothetical protein